MKRVNHSNNKERCSAGNLYDLLRKYCKSRYADLRCSDVHWNFWRMCNALRLESKVCNWYRLAISPIWRRRSTMFKKVYSLYSAFCTQPAFYPWSAVCSLQSAVCVLHWPIINTGFEHKCLYSQHLYEIKAFLIFSCTWAMSWTVLWKNYW